MNYVNTAPKTTYNPTVPFVSGIIDLGNDSFCAVLMPRPKRADEANFIYHALNRGYAKSPILKKIADFDAFERIIAE